MFRLATRFNAPKISPQAVNTYTTVFGFEMKFDPALVPQKKSHRKPRWIPTAKTKKFRVPTRPQIPKDEELELLRLNNNYRTQIKSIRAFLREKHSTLFQKSLDPEEILKLFREDFDACKAINDKWNEEIRVIREKRMEEMLQNDIEFAQKRMELELEKRHQLQELAESLVRKEKDVSSSFITAENIDEAIDKALESFVDYNFAIDETGEKIVGRETPVPVMQEKAAAKQ
ncbi:probable 28S ribosomal protein S26, mitochondrial [Anthonomus grandis grandis]|uniref:probable 28S ribosomal protein S26, mitochondrial n=1 Tax=Anthonomus grandis grandis TaxID=2921223 RepID=UPI0021662DA5|nr:probable 28S ribosomal protein S26, mitochondrial [Anthonomus grandis grandis]